MTDRMRTPVTPTDLYVLLARELKRRQPRPCKSCFIQLPYACESDGQSGANWRVELPADCGGDCRGIIEDLVAEYSQRYELRG